MATIDTTKVTTSTGIIFGNDDAPIKLIEFVNLRCPFCKQWWDEKIDLIDTYVESGQVQHIVKLFDKEKPSLAKGNVMHHYVPNDASAKDVLSSIYASQDEWGNLDSHEDIAKHAEDTLGLTLQDYEAMTQSVLTETKEANIVFVPTVIVGDNDFDQKISTKELKALLDS